MTKAEIILRFLKEGREWIKIVLPPLLALHLPTPTYMKPKPEKP